MKKFLIALLAIAVLFSFAACDNNSSEPGPDTGADGELIVTTPMIQDFAASINGLLDGGYKIANGNANPTGTATKISELLASLDETTFTANGSTASVSTEWYEVQAPVMAGETELIAGDKVKLTVSGDYSRAENVGTLTLTDYIYEFSLNRKDSAGEYALLTGSFSGKFVKGSLTVNFENATATTALSVTKGSAPAVILLPTAADYKDVTIGNLPVTGEQLFNFVVADSITASSDANTDDDAFAYQAYVDVRNDELEASLDSAVSAFMDAIDDVIIARFKIDSNKETDSTSGLISTTGLNASKGTATIQYSRDAEAAADATYEIMSGWTLPEGATLTIVFTDTDSETAGVQAGAYDIVGTLAYATASSTGDKFATISIDVNGLMATPTTFTAGTTAADAATIDSSSGSIAFAGDVGTTAGQYEETLPTNLVFEGSATGTEPTAICQSIDAATVVNPYEMVEVKAATN